MSFFKSLENMFRNIPLLAPLVDADRRMFHRIPISTVSVVLKGNRYENAGQGEMLDIIREGMTFRYPVDIEERDIIVDIFCEHTHVQEMSCQIVWVYKSKYRVHFVNLTPSQEKQIQRFIQQDTESYIQHLFH